MKNILIKTVIFGHLLFNVSCKNQETTRPTEKNVIDAVFASGNIEMEKEYLVTSITEGYIKNLRLSEGLQVTKNMTLVNISNEISGIQQDNAQILLEDAISKSGPNSPQVVQLNIQIEQAKAQVKLDQKNFERNEALVASKAISAVEYDRSKHQLESSLNNLKILEKALQEYKNGADLAIKNANNQLKIQQQNSNDFSIKSTSDGQVLSVFKKEGELVRRGETIAKIGSGPILIKLYIAEEDMSRIMLNQKVIVSLNTNKNKTFKAKIKTIYPSFDAQQQSFVIIAEFVETPSLLLSGTQLQANIIVEEKKNVLTIPTEYLIDGNKVMLKNKTFATVKTGIKNNEWVEVLEGLDITSEIMKPKAK